MEMMTRRKVFGSIKVTPW